MKSCVKTTVSQSYDSLWIVNSQTLEALETWFAPILHWSESVRKRVKVWVIVFIATVYYRSETTLKAVHHWSSDRLIQCLYQTLNTYKILLSIRLWDQMHHLFSEMVDIKGQHHYYYHLFDHHFNANHSPQQIFFSFNSIFN